MRALVLDKEDIEKYQAYINPLPEVMLESLDDNSYFSDCDEKSHRVCSSFEYDSKGFRAEFISDKAGLVYFSVPCSDGWTVKVNNSDTEIIKAHYGLSAVPIEQGNNKIEFVYETPGLKEGEFISLIALLILVVYIITLRKFKLLVC